MKKKIKLKPLAKILIVILFLLIALYLCLSPFKTRRESKSTKPKEIIVEKEKVVYEPLNEVSEGVLDSISDNVSDGFLEIAHEEESVEETYDKVIESISDTYTTRMTSFWANDGYGTGDCTGSGLCSWDFGVNDKGWFTYNGKLVVATATTYLANQGWFVGEGVHLYKYWEELVLTIDGIEYDAIILDSCGSSMKTDRVDLFVSNAASVKDTIIQVRRK